MSEGWLFPAVVGFVVGFATAWRTASTVERVREAVRRARHHWGAFRGYVTLANDQAVLLAATAGITVLVVVGVGWLVFTTIS